MVEKPLPCNVIANTPKNSSISAASATFDKNSADISEDHYRDVAVMMTLNGNSLNDIKLGGTSIGGGSYSVSPDRTSVTIKKEYLATPGTGERVFTFNFSARIDPASPLKLNLGALDFTEHGKICRKTWV